MADDEIIRSSLEAVGLPTMTDAILRETLEAKWREVGPHHLCYHWAVEAMVSQYGAVPDDLLPGPLAPNHQKIHDAMMAKE